MNSNSVEMIFLGTDVDINTIKKIDEKIVVTFELEKEKLLNEKGIKAIYFNRQAQNKKTWNEILKTAENWLNTWPDKTLKEGKSILEILKFEDISLWWFIYDVLWENKNGIFDTIYQVETLRSLFEEFDPKKVNICGKFEFPIVKMLYSFQKKYQFGILDLSNFEVTKSQNQRVISKKRVNFLLRLFILKIIHSVSKKKKGKCAIFSMHGGVINRLGEGNKLATDQYFIGLEEFIEKNRKIINFVSLDRKLNTKKFKNLISSTMKGEYEPWIVYYPIKGILNAYKISKDFRKIILSIEKNPDFIESMTIKGINIYPFLRDQFVVNLPFLVGLTRIELEAVRQFLSKNNPNTIFTTDGFGVSGRALNYFCTKNHKRVITPQLGIISPEFPINTAFFIRKKYDLRLLPEILVWGKFFGHLIENKEYPKKMMKQVGFWKTNSGEKIKKIQDDYVLYIAGANRSKLEYVLSLDEELFTIRRIHEVLPIGIKMLVKLHPNLDEKPYFEALSGLENIILVGNDKVVNVNELVSSSKIVIGKGSTIIIQAMILNKPVIVVNLAGKVDFLGIDKIPFVTSIEEFSDVMNHILDGKNTNQYTISEYCDPVGQKAINNVIREIMNN